MHLYALAGSHYNNIFVHATMGHVAVMTSGGLVLKTPHFLHLQGEGSTFLLFISSFPQFHPVFSEISTLPLSF